MDDDDEFYMAIIERRNKQRLIERGVRRDPMIPDYGLPKEEKPHKKCKRKGRRRANKRSRR
jgi:hypothetical protein